MVTPHCPVRQSRVKFRLTASGGNMVTVWRGGKGGQPELVAANPWAGSVFEQLLRAFSLPGTIPEAAITVRRDEEHAARAIAGRRAWNRWAQDMLAIGREIEPNTPLGRAFRFLSSVNLSGDAFQAKRGEFSEHVFPGDLSVSGLILDAEAWLSHCEFFGDFKAEGTRFAQGAWFEQSMFRGPTTFARAEFARTAEFRRCVFDKPTSFNSARFEKDGWFRGSVFASDLDAFSVFFAGEAGLGNIRYEGAADFRRATFKDNAGFDNTVFVGRADFSQASFERNTFFNGSRFHIDPSFDLARFAGRVALDGLQAPDSPSATRKVIEALQQRLG
jgi:Pentapeptide repeats (9 copies)